MKNAPAITRDPVVPTLFRLSLPMVAGTFASVLFNATDTVFVARLGTTPLAAVSFALPIFFFAGGVTSGLGLGVTAVLARAIGRGGPAGHAPLASAALLLGILIGSIITAFGLLTIEPVFTLLGASPDVLPEIRAYMGIWYLGMLLEVPLAVGAGLIRATGNTRFVGLMMMLKAALNAVLDPLLIFGLFGLPRLGLAGAAWGTVLAELGSLIPILWMLHCRLSLISLAAQSWHALHATWRRVLRIAIPTSATHCMVPFSYGALTRLAADFGPSMVAALGVAVRIESFAMVLISALQFALIPFVGQNWGANEWKRVRLGERASNYFSLAWGAFVWGLLVLAADPLIALLTADPKLVDPLRLFLWIVPAGYGFQGVFRVCDAVFNSIDRSRAAAILNIIRLFIFYVPMAYAGSALIGVPGLWLGVCLSNVFGGLCALFWMKRLWLQVESPQSPANLSSHALAPASLASDS